MYQNGEKNFNYYKRYKEISGKQDISQDKLSKLAGITLHTITEIESGATPDPRIETVKK